MLKRNIYILIFIVLPAFSVVGQEKDSADFVIGLIEEGDTVVYKKLDEITINPKELNRRQQRRYSRLVAKVKKVYPLAVEARHLLKEYEPRYYALEDQRDRRKLMKGLEKELLDKHKDELKRWSMSDGRLLLKLINRETERTPYSLIRDFRGEFSAVFWQGIARIFKNNLKDEYDPYGEDRMLEEIVTLVEVGYYGPI
ncbi:DUF4294 domain-containing protein [Maribellus comscasis]|uniref:DUF4294 domain-containing protein n=1 Tax=Maribellus comscasis TaxID=2681766 RepID=A0A6I6K1E2_9BACT|nr:DUF4294 domain-containing protein [Maribellus comscasis]QGY45253.1 DUF4294 domain-containing protein [Maribellus comscasis]